MGSAEASALVFGNEQMKGPYSASAASSNAAKFIKDETEWVF